MKNELVSTVVVQKTIHEVWEHWTNPVSIKIWNIPFDNWHCPNVENDLRNGGSFNFRMENADTKEGFNYTGIYARVVPLKYIKSICEDGRKNKVEFESSGSATIVRETFDPDSETPIETQQNFTDSILKNFKKFIEGI